MQSLRRATGKVPKIAIIGAGLSGLRCANILVQGGADVTVFEARDRIGGRVHQMESGGNLMDMGANWIHGWEKGNPIAKLAEQTRTVVFDPELSGAVFDSDGVIMPDEEAAELSSLTWAMIIQAFKYSDGNSERIDPSTSLFDYFKAELSGKVKDKRKLSNLLKEAQMWGPFVGDPVERQSLKFFYLEDGMDSSNVFVAGTYKKILQAIGKPIVEKGIIQFGAEIVKYELGDDGVRITSAAGRQETFDEAVVTCPLGWLKQNKAKAFSPPLPPRLLQAIDNIGYGRLEKLYITFPTAFWLDENSSTISTSSMFTHFQDPNYVPHPAGAPWNQSLVSLARLPSPTSHPTLLFYIYGPCATHLVHLIADHPPHSESYNAILTTFAQPFYSLLPQYDAKKPHCTPTSFLATQWQNDRFAGNGSYSNFQIGLEHAAEDIEQMRDAGGLTEKGLWLAGEHTAPFVALGTTTGAWWSGEAVAKRICKRYGIDLVDDEAVEVEGEGEGDIERKEPKAEKADAANLNWLAI